MEKEKNEYQITNVKWRMANGARSPSLPDSKFEIRNSKFYLNSKGFTLIELLIGMAILAVFLTAFYNLFISSNRNQIAQELEVEMQQNARVAAEFAVREMRNIQAITCMENTTTTCATAGDKISFTSMSDANTRIFSWSSADNSLRYYNPATLVREPLADNLTTFTLNGFDSSNNSTTTLANVKRIDITVTARTSRVDPNTGAYRTYNTKTTVMVRN